VATMIAVNFFFQLISIAGDTVLQSISGGENTGFRPASIEVRSNFKATADVANNQECENYLPHAKNILLKPAANCNYPVSIYVTQLAFQHGKSRIMQ